jgi:hypothetical protein
MEQIILQNQSELAQIYNEQKKKNKKDKYKERKEKNYYGDSAEYKRSWYKNGAQIYK